MISDERGKPRVMIAPQAQAISDKRGKPRVISSLAGAGDEPLTRRDKVVLTAQAADCNFGSNFL